jgi:hypothetical protein
MKPKDEKWYVKWGENRVALVERGRLDTSTKNRYATQAVVGSAEEAIDLTEQEFADALAKTRANTREGVNVESIRTPKREYTREFRPAARGLLLIYPIVDDENMSADFTESYVPALAVSFPSRLAAAAVGYIVTEDWLRQHGALDDWEEE